MYGKDADSNVGNVPSRDARVHRDRAADRHGDPRKGLEPADAVLTRESAECAARDPRAREDAVAAQQERGEAVGPYERPVDILIPGKSIRPRAEEGIRNAAL